MKALYTINRNPAAGWGRARPLPGPEGRDGGRARPGFFGPVLLASPRFLLAAALACVLVGCSSRVVYIDGSKKVECYPAGSTIQTPEGKTYVLKNANDGGSDKWWLMTDSYLKEIHDLIGKK